MKCTKKRDARAALLFWSENQLFFDAVVVVIVAVAQNKSSQRSGWDLNPGPPEYNLGALTARPRK